MQPHKKYLPRNSEYFCLIFKSAGKHSKMADDKERESLSDILDNSEINEDEEEVTAAEVLERLEQVNGR